MNLQDTKLQDVKFLTMNLNAKTPAMKRSRVVTEIALHTRKKTLFGIGRDALSLVSSTNLVRILKCP